MATTSTLDPQLLLLLMALANSQKQGTGTQPIQVPQTSSQSSGLQINPNQIGKGLNNIIKLFTNKGNLPSNLGDLGSIIGSIVGGKGMTGALAGLGGKVGGNIIGGAIGGDPFSWATPGGLAGFIPTLLGLAFPNQAKYLNAGTGLANAMSQLATGQPITTLGGNAIANLFGLGAEGAAGLAGANAALFSSPAAAASLEGAISGTAGLTGAGGGLGGGALMGMAPLLGPLGILGAMIGVGQLLTNDPSRMQKYGGKIKDLWGKAQEMTQGNTAGISKKDATFIANQIKGAQAADPNNKNYDPTKVKDTLFGGAGLTFLNYLAGKDPQLSLGLDWSKSLGLNDIKDQMAGWKVGKNSTMYDELLKNMTKRDNLFKAMYGKDNPQSVLLSGGKISQADWDKFFSGIRNPKIYDKVDPLTYASAGN